MLHIEIQVRKDYMTLIISDTYSVTTRTRAAMIYSSKLPWQQTEWAPVTISNKLPSTVLFWTVCSVFLLCINFGMSCYAGYLDTLVERGLYRPCYLYSSDVKVLQASQRSSRIFQATKEKENLVKQAEINNYRLFSPFISLILTAAIFLLFQFIRFFARRKRTVLFVSSILVILFTTGGVFYSLSIVLLQ